MYDYTDAREIPGSGSMPPAPLPRRQNWIVRHPIFTILGVAGTWLIWVPSDSPNSDPIDPTSLWIFTAIFWVLIFFFAAFNTAINNAMRVDRPKASLFLGAQVLLNTWLGKN